MTTYKFQKYTYASNKSNLFVDSGFILFTCNNINPLHYTIRSIKLTEIQYRLYIIHRCLMNNNIVLLMMMFLMEFRITFTIFDCLFFPENERQNDFKNKITRRRYLPI